MAGSGSPFENVVPSRRRTTGTVGPASEPGSGSGVERDGDHSSRPGQTLTNIQRTIAKFDTMQPRQALSSGLDALQPHLDRARYKAEAGISWRGYLNHHGLAGKLVGGEGEEGEEGLIQGGGGEGGGDASGGGGGVSGGIGESGGESDDGDGSEEGKFDTDELKLRAVDGWSKLS
jgi:hypothetical protein